jgi:hypothetical protein
VEKSILALINGSRNFKIKLRKGDEFQKLAETVNRLIEFERQNSTLIVDLKLLIHDYERTKSTQTLTQIKKLIIDASEELD